MHQNNQQIKSSFDINALIKNNISLFFKYFNIELESDNIKYYGCCPIHANSDNPTAIVIYKNTGIWLCNTHKCHEIFGKNAAGLIRGLLSSKKRGWQSEDDSNKVSSFQESKDFVEKFLNKQTIDKFEPVKTDEFSEEKRNFIRQVKLLRKINIFEKRDSFRKQCKIPSEYYLNRGFDKDILDKYDVGIMMDEQNYFYNRTIVPIYDIYYNYILGYTARINLDKCLVCGSYHDKLDLCIDKQNSFKIPKWEHSNGFRKENTLYNYWFARECISTNKRIILVEGPADIWKLEMADICYGVGIFGSNLSTNQINLIKKSHIKDIFLIGDNDEAGQKACNQMERVLGDQFSFHKVELEANDIGDMSIEDIRNIFK